MMTNVGLGTARDVSITSAQPRIIENEQGLLVDFKIIGTQVGSQPITPSLTADLGTIEPSQTALARWLMTSTLVGEFTSFEATYKHLDDLGDPRTSLIDSVAIHELTRAVRAMKPEDDGLIDFLTNDVPDPDNLPDTLHDSSGAVFPVSAVAEALVDGTPSLGNFVVQVSAGMPNGWSYLRFDDPSDGQFRLARIARTATGEVLLADNAWTTHRVVRDDGPLPYRWSIHALLRG
jgi:hypothetical protein